MMNIKRIIREELEAVLDSFYLLVSEDENFIYKRGHLGGYRWESVKSLTPKEIINSGFKEYSEPEEMISRMKRGSTNLTPKNQDTKIVPKIVPVDFIIKKREETFPILESNDNDFNWIKEITPFTPGKLFNEDDICFNSEDCNININKDNITFKIDWEVWGEAVDLDPDDEWLLRDILFNGPNYDGDDDFYEFDSDEFNYSGYHVSGVQENRFQEILNKVSPGSDFSGDYQEDNMNDLFGVLQYPKLRSLFWKLQDEFLNNIGYTVQKNRWIEMGSVIREEMRSTGIDFDLYYNNNGHKLQIVVPIDEVFSTYDKKNVTDLSELIISISTFLTETSWYDRFYDHWDTSGDEDLIEEIFNDFLDKSEDFLEDKKSLKLYEKLKRMLDELGFVNMEKTFQVNPKYYKENFDGTKLLLDIDEDMNCVFRLYNSSYNINSWSNPEHIAQWVFKSPLNINEIKNKILAVSKGD